MYNYKFENGHCLIELEGEKWFLDTGSPNTFTFDGNKSQITIEGKQYQLATNPGYVRSVLEEVIGCKINGIIGADLLQQTSFTLYNNDTMEFNANPKLKDNPIDVKIRGCVIIGKIQIVFKEATVLFETGSYINYINPVFVKGEPYGDIWYDKDLHGNTIESKPYLAPCDIHGKLSFGYPLDLKCFPMQVMGHYQCDAIIGLNDKLFNRNIFDEYIVFDYKKGKIYLK